MHGEAWVNDYWGSKGKTGKSHLGMCMFLCTRQREMPGSKFLRPRKINRESEPNRTSQRQILLGLERKTRKSRLCACMFFCILQGEMPGSMIMRPIKINRKSGPRRKRTSKERSLGQKLLRQNMKTRNS